MVWMIFSVVGIPVREQLQLNATEFGLLTAMPVLSGSLIRIPLGMWTDRFGGRIVFAILMLVCVPAIWLMSSATAYWQFLVIGLFVGLAGGSFSVGTPYVARWFPRHRQGLAMGIFGAGNSGAAVNKFLAPVLIGAWGWAIVPKVYAVVMLLTVAVFWMGSADNPSHRVARRKGGFAAQWRALSDLRVWRYSQYYSVVFGGYVGLSLWLVQYCVGEYGLSLPSAALLAACFSLPGGVLRAVGGWLSDRWGAHRVTWWVMCVSWLCLLALSWPGQPVQSAHPQPGLNIVLFTVLVFVLGMAWAFGKASVFKYISDDFEENIGAVSGVVGLAGGLGGFVFPILFGALLDLTGIRASAFMLLLVVVSGSLLWMYFAEVRPSSRRSRAAATAIPVPGQLR